MECRAAASLLVALLLMAAPASARPLPAIKASADNQAEACVTPGRLMAFVKARNPRLDGRFDGIATEYMRHGEALGVRWDYAFFQMLYETGNLGFGGDVRPSQNNFAGLGATGRGERGESFPTVSAGVIAHLQHLLLYAGEAIESPVAERTRKVQQWGILTSWQRTIKGPVTFADLARKWAPGVKSYVSEMEGIAQAFYSNYCRRPDPRPELVAEARRGRQPVVAEAAATTSQAGTAGQQQAEQTAAERPSGSELARRAVEQARAEGQSERSGLGASEIARRTAETQAAVPDSGLPRAQAAIGEFLPAASNTAQPAREEPRLETAMAPPAAKLAPPAPPAPKCRVWTASYGGQKAIIIRAVQGPLVNYTVLDVNEGQEKREAEAYIAAYAKGGQQIAEFPNQTLALDKAFELCPEG